MKQEKGIRVAIIGAGPAGLSAAETLKEKGYKHVTLFEKSDHAGGKCCSVEYHGKWYELGAGILSENNIITRGFAKKYAVPMEVVDFKTPSLILGEKTGLPLPPRSWIENIQLLLQGLRYRQLIKKYHRVTLPGFTRIDSDLHLPFSVWAEKHNLSLIAYEFGKYFTGFGYDFFEDIPAAYVLKYYSWETVRAFLQRKFYKFPGGIQHLWTEVAKHHHVLYNTHVTQVKRGTRCVELTTNHGHMEFEAVILCAPLDEATTHYLDATSEEQELFSKIKWCDYRVFGLQISGFPKQTGYAPGNYTTKRKGHPVFWYLRHPDQNFYTFYALGDWKMTNEQMQQHIADLIRPLGGKIEHIETIRPWKYFPHVTSEDMKNGYFDKLEALQGKKRTYYAGELLNFSTVEQSAWYAKNLVERFF